VVNEKNHFFTDELPGERMKRLQSTLKGRLNILNIFEPLVNNKYKRLTMRNIEINIKDEYEIVNFLLNNNNRIDYLYEAVANLFSKEGIQWQKNRLAKKII